MVDGDATRAPTAHVSAEFIADYPAVNGEVSRGPTAHVTATLTAAEPGS